MLLISKRKQRDYVMNTDKLVVDGKVAVLVSSGYGAGWSTWNGSEEMLFDKEVAEILLDKTISDEEQAAKIFALCEVKYPDAYLGGVDGLHVEWVDEGDRFFIKEYDGAETIKFLNHIEYYVA